MNKWQRIVGLCGFIVFLLASCFPVWIATWTEYYTDTIHYPDWTDVQRAVQERYTGEVAKLHEQYLPGRPFDSANIDGLNLLIEALQESLPATGDERIEILAGIIITSPMLIDAAMPAPEPIVAKRKIMEAGKVRGFLFAGPWVRVVPPRPTEHPVRLGDPHEDTEATWSSPTARTTSTVEVEDIEGALDLTRMIVEMVVISAATIGLVVLLGTRAPR